LKWKLIHPSKILFSAYYTTAKQYLFYLNPEVFFVRGKLLFSGEFSYEKLIEKFYGFGPDSPEINNPSYKMMQFSSDAKFYYSISEKLLSGIRLYYKNVLQLDPMNNPLLANGSVSGHSGGLNSGLGALFRYDSRDNIFYPSDGYFIELSATYYWKGFGGDYNFEEYLLNVRKYWRVAEKSIFAAEFYYNSVYGGAPFYSYPKLGGAKRMRGYYEGRFRDRRYLAAQSEIRYRLFKRIFGIAFVGAGDVVPSEREFSLRTFKLSYGFGVRYRLSEKEKMNIRCDVGFGKNDFGIYFQAEEAF